MESRIFRSVGSPIPRMELLDARAVAAGRKPVAGAVSIPESELPSRTHELPPKHECVLVADTGPEAAGAVEWLREHGRQAEAVSFRFAEQDQAVGRLWEPNEFLAERLSSLSPGVALDLGCGTGRDAVYMASAGWRVIAIDRLRDALGRGEALARRYLASPDAVSWTCTDLRSDLPELPEVDLVTMFFFMDRRAVVAALAALKPGGHVLAETFTPTHRARFGKPKTVLSGSEIVDAFSGSEILSASEAWRADGRHTARIAAMRR